MHKIGAAARAAKAGMTSDSSPTKTKEAGRVLPFSARIRRGGHVPPTPVHSPVEDLEKYAKVPADDDDYRHRMITNAVAFAFVVVLIVCGTWLANSMAQMRRNQDCVLSGKRNCAPIEVPIGTR